MVGTRCCRQIEPGPCSKVVWKSHPRSTSRATAQNTDTQTSSAVSSKALALNLANKAQAKRHKSVMSSDFKHQSASDQRGHYMAQVTRRAWDRVELSHRAEKHAPKSGHHRQKQCRSPKFFFFFYPSSSLSGDTVVVSHGNSEDRLHSPRLGE